MQPIVKRHTAAVEYDTAERCLILETANDTDDPEVSIARARVKPGVTTAWHHLHNVTERYLIITGHGRVEVGELAPTEVGPGDVVRIPPGIRQRITNTGDDDLVFYAICSPRFTPNCYVSLE